MAEPKEEDPLIKRDSHTEGIDLSNRDPKKITEGMAKVNFEDVIAEPDGIRSLDRVWNASNKTFTVSKSVCYCGLSAIFSVLLSLLWGLLFAFLSFCHIWAVVPCIKSCEVVFHCLFRPCLHVIQAFLRPLFKAGGKIYSTVKGVIRKEA